jgi:hypothetical protein
MKRGVHIMIEQTDRQRREIAVIDKNKTNVTNRENKQTCWFESMGVVLPSWHSGRDTKNELNRREL